MNTRISKQYMALNYVFQLFIELHYTKNKEVIIVQKVLSGWIIRLNRLYS